MNRAGIDVDVAVEVTEGRVVVLWCMVINWDGSYPNLRRRPNFYGSLAWYCPRRSDHALQFRKDGEEWVLSSEMISYHGLESHCKSACAKTK